MVQVGFTDVVTVVDTYEKVLVSSSYPVRDVVVERQVIVTDPAKAIYRTVIPNQTSCSGKNYVTAPVKANVDGSLPVLAKIDRNISEESKTIRAESGHADFVIEPGSSLAEIAAAQEKAARILSGEHHVDNFTRSGVAREQTNIVTKETETQAATTQVLPLVDIENKYRPEPTTTKVGFLPVGGTSGSTPSGTLLPMTDPNRFGTASDLVTNKDALPTSANQINKFTSVDGSKGDIAVVSNDLILKIDGSVPPTTPQGTLEPRKP